MELDERARELAWSLVVRSGYVTLPLTQFVYVQRKLGHEVSRVRRESSSGIWCAV